MSDGVSRRTFMKMTTAGAAALTVGDAFGQAPETIMGNASPLVAAQAAALDPQAQKVIDNVLALEPPMINTLTPFNARQGSPLTLAVLAVLAEQGKPPLEAVGDVSHLLIPSPGGQLLIRIYTPRGNGPFPGLVYFHGGGWVIGNLDSYDSTCRALTNAAGCVVVSVAYRLAPEMKFPAAADDAYAATQWVMANAARLNVDPARVAVAGESAGGNLATVTTLMARDKGGRMPIHQVLVYPVTNYAFDTASYQENANAVPLNKPLMQWFWGYYLRSEADGANPYASPLRAANLRGLPSATVITAQVDPLRDEGEAYAARLREAGVKVKATRYDGVMHEFFSMSGVIDKAKQAVAEAAGELKAAFGTA